MLLVVRRLMMFKNVLHGKNIPLMVLLTCVTIYVLSHGKNNPVPQCTPLPVLSKSIDESEGKLRTHVNLKDDNANKSHNFNVGRKEISHKKIEPKDVENLEVNILPSARNVTPPNPTLLVYNRVPKTSSTRLIKVIESLQQINHFTHKHVSNSNPRFLTKSGQRKLMKKIQSDKKHLYSFDRHVHYFNLTILGYPNAAWVNIARDPLERFISEFYFMRTKSFFSTVWKMKKRPSDEYLNMDLNVCILDGHPECLLKPGQITEIQLTYFCGNHIECRTVGSRWALQRAKRHVESYYSVVGILEELPLFMKLVERYVPMYFKGLHTLDWSTGEQKVNERVKSQRKPVTNATREIIRGFLKEDFEMYEFLRQRLHLQAKELGIQS